MSQMLNDCEVGYAFKYFSNSRGDKDWSIMDCLTSVTIFVYWGNIYYLPVCRYTFLNLENIENLGKWKKQFSMSIS